MDIASLHNKFIASSGVCTDTRNIHSGCIFFALKGDRFNGNEYAWSAIEQGASYAIIDEKLEQKDKKLILVDDVLTTLQDLAAYHRSLFEIPVVGITGSNGKTTSKELIRDVLKMRFNVLATKGNLNNHLGVPLTLLELKAENEIAIIEMGANHIGEIELLCSIADPTLGNITNIGQAHIGEFGSQENIIQAKCELFEHLKMIEGPAFVPSSSNVLMDKSVDLDRITYGMNPGDDHHVQVISFDPYLSIKWNGNLIETHLVGEYNTNNIASAIAIGSYFEIPEKDIVDAISSYHPDNNRSQLLQLGNKRIISDAYNANPDSMNVALNNFFKMKSEKKFWILGDMLELGDHSDSAHKNILDSALGSGIPGFVVGPEFNKALEVHDASIGFQDVESVIGALKEMDLSDTLILIKGSRGIKLEKVLEAL